MDDLHQQDFKYVVRWVGYLKPLSLSLKSADRCFCFYWLQISESNSKESVHCALHSEIHRHCSLLGGVNDENRKEREMKARGLICLRCKFSQSLTLLQTFGSLSRSFKTEVWFLSYTSVANRKVIPLCIKSGNTGFVFFFFCFISNSAVKRWETLNRFPIKWTSHPCSSRTRKEHCKWTAIDWRCFSTLQNKVLIYPVKQGESDPPWATSGSLSCSKALVELEGAEDWTTFWLVANPLNPLSYTHPAMNSVLAHVVSSWWV